MVETSGSHISVVIPCHNSALTLAACVESVLSGNLPPAEVLIVDDASTDDSVAVIRSLEGAHPGRVRGLCLDVNAGPSTARNLGARAARNDLLFFIDSDTLMLPDALGAFSESIAECDAVVGIYHHKPLNRGVVPSYKALLNYYYFQRVGRIPYEVFDASRAGIRRDVFLELGGFNEQLRSGMDYENEEFGYRLVEKHTMVLDPRVQVQHHFPGLLALTKNYFFRVAQWMGLFLRRRRFESGGVTTATMGASTLALLLSLGCLACGVLFAPVLLWASAAFGAFYVYGYLPFFSFVVRRQGSFLVVVLALNIYFTLVISLGAFYGAVRYATGMKKDLHPSS